MRIMIHHIFSAHRARCVCCLVLLALSCAVEKKTARIDIPDLSVPEDSFSLENTCRRLSLSVMRRSGQTDTAPLALFYRTLDRTSDSLNRALGKEIRTLAGKNALLDAVYKKWNMAFDPRDDAVETLLPHAAFGRRKGNCLGVSLMVLMLAERTHCPLGGVVLPGHFFCRYDDGEFRENIEPNRSGYAHSDDYYRAKYLSPGVTWYDLKNLTLKETAGVLWYAVGTIFLKRNDPGFAAACLKESRRLVPFLAETQGNLALAWALCGSGDSALSIFEELFGKYPAFANLAANYGAVAMATGHPEKSLEVYKKGLSLFPGDPVLLLGYSRAYAACLKTDSRK